MRIYVDGKKIGASPYNAKELNDSKASLYIGVGIVRNGPALAS